MVAFWSLWAILFYLLKEYKNYGLKYFTYLNSTPLRAFGPLRCALGGLLRGLGSLRL
jgi:hypothetical protein